LDISDPDLAFRRFFERDPITVARGLIGSRLMVGQAGGTIVETEAYADKDPASHSFKGQTIRNASMFGAPGIAYVYRSYGVHWCLNFVCTAEGCGCAVLIRALEPTIGLALMRSRRGVRDVRQLCSGPGRLTQALGITGAFDGLRLDAAPFALSFPAAASEILSGMRIGISRGNDLPWRFGLRDSAFLSRRFS
jgi:DNA-3-methyladenine glycosylase